MRRFRFRLEAVLRWRRSQFELEQARLHQLLAEREIILQRIRQLERRRQAEEALLRRAEASGAELAALDQFRQAVRRERAGLEKALLECDRRVAAQRERVLAARRAVQVLEQLRQRRRLAWEAELSKEEETLAAETHLAQWTRG